MTNTQLTNISERSSRNLKILISEMQDEILKAVDAAFEEAIKADPQCAMAHWGIAMAVGPTKVPSIIAGARAGWFDTLITDEDTAVRMLDKLG
jgi:hypothetical protein